MSYHLYQTEGLVLESGNIGESNRYFYIFTEELGLVVAFAQGVRELKSKLRYHMQDLSYVSLGLIRGREFWRVTSAEKVNRFDPKALSEDKLALLTRLSRFLKRFLHGEEKNERLFADFIEGCEFLGTETLDGKALENLELLLVARMLHALGYWGEREASRTFLSAPLSLALLQDVEKGKSGIRNEVNRALKESHL